VPLYEKSIRLDPRDPFLFNRYAFLGFSAASACTLGRSGSWFERSLAANPEAIRPIRRRQIPSPLARAYAMTGRPMTGTRVVGEANTLWPFATVRTNSPENPTNAVLAAQIEELNEALRLAGVRDHAEEDADFGVVTDDKLHQDLAGQTPTTVPGAATIKTRNWCRSWQRESRSSSTRHCIRGAGHFPARSG